VQSSKDHRRAIAPLGRTFRVSLILKAADAVLEMVGGVLFLVVPPSALGRIVVALTQHELSEDPHDLVANFLREATQHLVGARSFGAVYLLSHGVSKIVLVVEIFRGRLWAYPAMLVLLGAFIVYQTYRLVHAFTIGMLALTLFDLFVVWLTWREYGRQRERLSAPEFNDG
jgi:uncharacterized membrane protein